MIQRYEHKDVTWYEVLKPTPDEIRELFTECNLPASFAGDLTSMTPLTEVKAERGALKITLDFPIVKRTDMRHPHEVKFIMTKNSLVTIRFEDIGAIENFAKSFEVLTLLKSKKEKGTGAHLFLSLLKSMYENMSTKLDYLESRMRTAEEDLFSDNEKEMLQEISEINRRIISFRHTLNAHDLALAELETKITSAFGPSYVSRVAALRATYQQLTERVAAFSHTIENLRDTNNTLLTAKQNEVMKTLTVMAFVTFPLTLFASLFGMNTTTTPLVGYQHDFWVIMSIMVVVSVGFFYYFKHKGWF
jgi:magnesium transporter